MRTFHRGRALGAGISRGGIPRGEPASPARRVPSREGSGTLRGFPTGLLWLAVVSAGCLTKDPPEAHFFDQHIQPILKTFCVGNTSPCHAVDKNSGTALGNLDLTSFDSIQKRRDVLRTYGSYPH